MISDLPLRDPKMPPFLGINSYCFAYKGLYIIWSSDLTPGYQASKMHIHLMVINNAISQQRAPRAGIGLHLTTYPW